MFANCLARQSLLYVLCYRMETFADGSSQSLAVLRALPLDRFAAPLTHCAFWKRGLSLSHELLRPTHCAGC